MLERRIYPKGPAFVGLVISLIGSWLITPLYRELMTSLGVSGVWAILSYTIAQVTCFALLLLVMRWEGSELGSVWFGDRRFKAFLESMAFLAVAWVLWGFLYWLGGLLNLGTGYLDETLKRGLGHPSEIVAFLSWGLLAAFFEETFYRGYSITRLYSLTGNLVASAAISITFFTFIHLYFGPRVMLCILGWAILDTWLFLRKGTYASFYYHLVNNVLADGLLPVLSLVR